MTRRTSQREPGEPAPERAGSGHLDEHRLLDRVREGVPEAFEELVRRHQVSVFGLIARMVHDESVAEELTQDVFVKAFRKVRTFRGEAKLSTWLYRIAVNVCHDYRASVLARTRKNEISLHHESGPELPASDPRPDESVLAREMAGDFQQALDGLEDGHRAAFLLRHQEGLSYDEIAEAVEISVSNAKVRVHRAREMILKHLRRRGHHV